jgi:hypothetical protein
MLLDYRHWLETELKLLGNAANHAFSFGQATMAKRALERFDQEIGGRVPLALERGRVDAILTALEEIEERATALDPALEALRVDLQTARTQAAG